MAHKIRVIKTVPEIKLFVHADKFIYKYQLSKSKMFNFKENSSK